MQVIGLDFHSQQWQEAAAGQGDEAGGSEHGHGFGTAPVFLASISTILGAILFLRFGYSVAHVGLWGTLMIVLLGHMVTIPTAMAVSEIATNRRVAGGGAYFIISRSFGTTIGGAIGVSLYLSQAISVAFYMVAFAEAFQPVYAWTLANYGFAVDPRFVSIPATLMLLGLVLRKGASVGVQMLWVVCAVLGVSLAMFFLGTAPAETRPDKLILMDKIPGADSFGRVFSIVFPAFTGLIAGLGLSGDLRNPQRSIPLGTLSATIAGMAVYILVAIKLAMSFPPDTLASDQLIMSRIAIWGPIIPIGLGAATLSSAVGSFLVAPRTMQALARDRIFPVPAINNLLARGEGAQQEPVPAAFVSAAIALLFVALGDVDFVAQILTMFFMVTYGALCLVSFLEHFSGNPSYRPTFRSRWYLSLLGGVLAFFIMIQIQPGFALISFFLLGIIYMGLRYTRQGERDLAAIFQGVMFQLTRRLQIALQKGRAGTQVKDWRPAVVAITRHTNHRIGHFDLLRWICHRHGFGHFIHFIEGQYTAEATATANVIAERLIQRTESSRAGIFVDTIISPSLETALLQILQLPGISGLPNNTVLFEYDRNRPHEVDEVISGLRIVVEAKFNVCVLRSSEHRFGYRRKIHIWLRQDDLANASLMILLAYIIVGHRDWRRAEIRIFIFIASGEVEETTGRLSKMIQEGRLPISPHNLTPVLQREEYTMETAVERYSAAADLAILGLDDEQIVSDTAIALSAYSALNDVLFVKAAEDIPIS